MSDRSAVPVASKQRRHFTGLLMLAWGEMIAFYLIRSFEGVGAGNFWMEWLWGVLLLVPLVVMATNRWFHWNLLVTAIECPRHHEGERAHVMVTIKNRNRFPVADVTLNYRLGSAEVDLAAGEERTVRIPLSDATLTRGCRPLDEVVVATGYPFGLLRASRTFSAPGISWVYPSVEANAPRWPLEQRHAWKRARYGEESLGVRPYVAGDPMRIVNWKASARQSELVVREFEKQAHKELVLAWEQVAHLGLEPGLRRLTAWVLRAHHQRLTYTLVLPTVALGPSRGSGHLQQSLEALARFRTPEVGA